MQPDKDAVIRNIASAGREFFMPKTLSFLFLNVR